MSQQLIGILQQYINDLTQISFKLNQSSLSPIAEVKLLGKKIDLKMNMYRSTISALKRKESCKGGLQALQNYHAKAFGELAKEAYRVLHIRAYLNDKENINESSNQNKLKGKLDLIKEVENEMCEEWEKEEKWKNKENITHLNTIPMLNASIENSEIKGLAKEYLQKEFLAIRMISYKMYEQYVGHQHAEVYQRMDLVREQQRLLLAEIQEIGESNKELIGNEKRLIRELAEVKRINTLISQRYLNSKVALNQD